MSKPSSTRSPSTTLTWTFYLSGRYAVDAKSIMGIFSLDLSKEITMEVHSDDCADFLAEIKPFIVQQ